MALIKSTWWFFINLKSYYLSGTGLLHIEISWNSPIVCRIRYTNDSQSFKKIYQRILELWTILAKIMAKITNYLAFEVISLLLHIEISWNSPIVCRIRYTKDSQSFKKIYLRILELWTTMAKIVAKISYFLAFEVISLLLHIEIFWNSPIVCRIRCTNDSQSFKKLYQRISELWTIMAKIVAKISYFLAFKVISLLLHIEISWNSPTSV